MFFVFLILCNARSRSLRISHRLGPGGGGTASRFFRARIPCQKVVYPQLTLQVLNIKGDYYFDIILGGGGGKGKCLWG